MKIILVDCDDSFTYNIMSDFKLFTGLDLEVVHHQKLEQLKSKSIDALIFGPGPGHPDDYVHLKSKMNALMVNNKPQNSGKSPKLIGICLGHQLLCQVMGAKIVQDKQPLHGQSVVLNFSDLTLAYWKKEFGLTPKEKDLKVQRYNSLYVSYQSTDQWDKKFEVFSDDALMWVFTDQFFSMQFHPESLGTRERDFYFHMMAKVLKS